MFNHDSHIIFKQPCLMRTFLCIKKFIYVFVGTYMHTCPYRTEEVVRFLGIGGIGGFELLKIGALNQTLLL